MTDDPALTKDRLRHQQSEFGKAIIRQEMPSTIEKEEEEVGCDWLGGLISP